MWAMESLPLEVGIPAVSRSQVTSLSGPYPEILIALRVTSLTYCAPRESIQLIAGIHG